MKHGSSRWSCQLVRSFNAVFTAGDGAGSRHIATCAACQAYYAATSTLEDALRAEARQSPVAPNGLHAGIMRAVAESTAGSQPRPRTSSLAPWLIAAAACVAVAFVSLRWQPDREAASPTSVALADVSTIGTLVSNATGWSRIAEPVQSVLDDASLRSEADLMYANARSAVSFLALNFLPSDSVAANAPDASNQSRIRPARG